MAALNRSPLMKWMRRTPLHPQWLLESRDRTEGWICTHARGLVLDIGCADRWIEARLPASCEYLALDHPEIGGGVYKARPDVFGDAVRLPFPTASVDTVLLLDVLEHLSKPAQALAEIERVLRPGGRLLLTVPFLYPIHDAPFDYQRYTEYGLSREIKDADLVPREIEPSLGAAKSGGLMLALAIGGMASKCIARKSPALLLLPFLVGAILMTNLTCSLLARLLPPWPALAAGYRVLAVKP